MRSASFPVLVAAVLFAGLGGCRAERGEDGRRQAPEAPLLVLAASDLQYALPEIVAAYQGRTRREVNVMLGSTGNLTAQIEQGAPGEVFLAANESFVDRLESRGLVRPGSKRAYALGRIVVAWAGDQPPVADLTELADPRYRAVAIANPEHAPYGEAAREALTRAGLWDELRPRLVYGENVSQAYHLVATGNTEAGIVALGVVLGIPETPYLPIDAELHAPLRQTAAVLRDAADPEAAEAFIAFVMDEEGQAILRRYGFDEPGR